MLKLVKMERKYAPQLFEMMDEWSAAKEKIIPWAIRKCDYHDLEKYIDGLDVLEGDETHVPDSTFFCLDTERNIFVGAVNIRHYLNEELLHDGGDRDNVASARTIQKNGGVWENEIDVDGAPVQRYWIER